MARQKSAWCHADMPDHDAEKIMEEFRKSEEEMRKLREFLWSQPPMKSVESSPFM